MKKTFIVIFAAFAIFSCSTEENDSSNEQTSITTLNRENTFSTLLLEFNIDEKDLEKTNLSNYSEANSTTAARTVWIVKDCSYFSAHFGYAYGFGHDSKGNQYYWWTTSKGTFSKLVKNSWCH